MIDHLCLDEVLLVELTTCITELHAEFKSVIEVNKGLCGVHHTLAKTAYDNFFQIGLTDSTVENTAISMDECEVTHTELHNAGYRHRKELVVSPRSLFNESTYTVKTDTYKKYEYIFDKVLSRFKGETTRIRLVKLAAGTSLQPHIDYDPSYAVRIIIPIIADSECINVFWAKNTVESMSMIPGNAYFLNTGYKHAVMNFSKQDRYTFMISVNGTEDIQHLLT